MDSIKTEKINAIKKYKRDQLLKNLFLYSMTGLACLFYSTPFWFPTITSSMEVLFLVYIPNLKSVLFSSKFVFILGNIIIFALIGESRIFSSDTSPASEAYLEEYISRKKNLQKFSTHQEKKAKRTDCEDKAKLEGKTRAEKRVGVVEKIFKDFDGDYNEATLPTEDLKKRADDFIARVNKHRIFEARELLCDVEWRKRIAQI